MIADALDHLPRSLYRYAAELQERVNTYERILETTPLRGLWTAKLADAQRQLRDVNRKINRREGR